MARCRLLLLIFLFSIVAVAQTIPRDYTISLPRVTFTADGATAVVSFTITNQGGDAIEASQFVISENQSGDIQVSEPLPILAADQAQLFRIALPLADLPGDDLFFKIEAGIDEYELAGSPIARNNTQLFRINKAEARSSNGAAPISSPAEAAYDLFIPLVNLGVNFLADGVQINESRYSNDDLLRFVGLAFVALFCLWLLSLILRLIFRRPPKFETWQPPYAVHTWYDPNSALGRRQSWQFHAQSSAISAPNAPDQVTVIKRLLGRDGVILAGWKIKAIRTVQYDIYGRINRTEVVMPQSINKQLNRIIRSAPAQDNPALRKAINPVARRLGKYALAAIEKQNRMLPLAMDMRLEGVLGEARVLFELYQCRNNAWHLIDQWEPEMGQIGARVPEHFSFTLNGQLPGENYREYKTRLRADLAQLLADMFYHHQDDDSPDTEPKAQPMPLAESPVTDTSERFGDLLNPDDETDAR